MAGSTISLSASRIYGAAIAGVQGIYIARLLGPQLFGVFNLIYLIGWYISLVQPGARDVAYRDIPFYRGRKDPDREKLTRDVSISCELLWRGFCSLALAIAALFLKDSLLRVGLVVWAGSMFVARVCELYSVLSTAEQDFVFVSWVNAIKLTLTFATILLTIRWLSLYGALLGPAVGGAFAIYLFARRHPLAFSFSLDRPQLRRMLRFGLPLALLTFVYWLYASADRSIIALVLPRIELGYYAAAAFIVQFLTQLPADFITVLQPHLYRELGKDNQLADAKALVVGTTRAYAYLSPLAILLLWIWLPPIVHWLLPKYDPALPVVQILSLNVFFASALAVPYTMLYSPGINRQTLCAGVWGGSALLTAGVGYLLLRLGYGINGVAIATVLGQSAAAAAFFYFTRAYYRDWMGQNGFFYLELVGPMAYAACILAGMHYLLPLVTLPLLSAAAWSPVLVLLYLPWLLLLSHRIGVLKLRWAWHF